jgi:hypothetical protein
MARLMTLNRTPGNWTLGLFIFFSILPATLNAAAILTANELAPNSLVITEYLANPIGVSDSQAEYFEIFNTTGSDIELADVVVRDDGSNEFTVSGLLIRAFAFAVFGNSDSAALGFAPDYVYGGMSLTNTDDEISLFRPDGDLIHKLAYTDGDFFGAGVAHELAALTANTPTFLMGPLIGEFFIRSTGALALGNFGSPGTAGRTSIDLDPGTPPAVPVPASLWMFASGLSILGWVRRKLRTTTIARATGGTDERKGSTGHAGSTFGNCRRDFCTRDVGGAGVRPGPADGPDHGRQSRSRPRILAPVCRERLECHCDLPQPRSGGGFAATGLRA